jgi:hypothetical protein
LQDSGWGYVANYSAADAFRPNLSWGYKQGCAFATGKCLVLSGGTLVGQGNPPHFYPASHVASAGDALCTTDATSLAYSAVKAYATALPTQYQYWSGVPKRGGDGPDPYEYCPAVLAYSDGRCADPANSWR